MSRIRWALRVSTAIAIAGCASDSPLGPEAAAPSSDPTFTISDGAHGGGRTGFYFLPPMVPNPGPLSGTFDTGLSPTVEICPLDAAGTACAGAPVATLVTGTGPTDIKADASGGSYNANWKGSSALDPSKHYRLQVFVDPDGSGPKARILLGFADVDVVTTAQQAKQVDDSRFVPLVKGHPLQIRFRVETGTVGTVAVAPVTASITVGNNQGFTATVTDLYGNTIAGATIAWSSSDAAVATFSPPSGATTTATGVGGGVAQIRATSGGVTGSATLTVIAQTPPAAAADSHDASAGGTLSVAAPGVLGNDALGVPVASLASFGGGSLGGAVTDHAAGSTATFGGGSLTMSADGSFTFTPAAGFSGTFTFQYRITNAAGSSDAAVTIGVNAPATAVDDGPAASSAPGSSYHTFLNSALNLAAPGVLANDQLGFPAAALASFGGGSLGGAATDHAAGSTASLAGGASLTVNADGSLVFTPAPGFTGNFTFQYRIANLTGSSAAQVTIAVGARPATNDDSYPHALVGNVPVNTASSTGFSVLANDQGDMKTLAVHSASNGTAILNLSTGTFEFIPTPGYEGPAGFTYSVTNGFGTVTGTVSLNVSGMVWFIDNNAGAGNGSLGAPFNSLAAFHAVNDGTGNHPEAGDNVFVHESAASYEGPLTLLDGQKLIGQDATSPLSSLTGLTPPADSPPLPAMNSSNGLLVNLVSAGNGVTVAQNNEIHGLRIGNSAGTALSGSGFGTLRVSALNVNNSQGPALALSNGTLSGTFVGIGSAGGTRNLSLTGVNGTADLGTGALSGSTAAAFQVSGGSATLSYSGSIVSTAGRSVSISGRTGGTLTLSGSIGDSGTGLLVQNNTGGAIAFTGSSKTISTGTAAGVSLANNTGAAVHFTGGGLAITTTSGNGFNATGGGTVTVQGGGNTISSSGGTALNVSSTTIGSGGLAFQSISANGGTHGIALSGTGSGGSLTVTGTASAGSGGTIQNTSGAGISLNGTLSPSFAYVNLQSTGRSGVDGTGVTNFSFTNGTINNSGTAGTDNADSNIDFYGTSTTTESNLAGVVTITGNTLTNARGHGIDIGNGSGTISELSISSNTITSSTSATSSFGSGMRIVVGGGASTTAHLTKATISNNVISNFPGDAGIRIDCGNVSTSGAAGTCGIVGSATNRISIAANRIAGDATTKMGTRAIYPRVAGQGQANFDISGNGTVAEPLRNTVGHVIDLSATGQAQVTATISNNRIQANNVLNSRGITVGADSAAGFATTTVLTATISGNSISATSGAGIAVTGTRSGSTVKASITNNNVSAPTGGNYGIAVFTNPNNTVTPTVCVNITGNTTAGGTASGTTWPGIGLTKRTSSTFGIVGLSPSPAGTPTVENYVNGLNTSASGTFGTGGTALGSATTGFTSCTL